MLTHWNTARFAIAGILSVAASLKADEVQLSLLAGRYRSLPATTVWLIAMELAGAVWLVSGVRPRWARSAHVLLFTLFGGHAALSALAGEESCGCFGRWRVDPRLTLAVDAAIVAWLLSCTVTERSSSPCGFCFTVLVSMAFGIASAALVAVTWSRVGKGHNPLGTPGAIVAPNVRSWIGKPLPLDQMISSFKGIASKGELEVLLVHRDCPRCAAAAGLHVQKNRAAPLALIEVPPFKGPSPWKEIQRVSIHSLPEDRDWFLETPTLIVVRNGIVADVSIGEEVFEKEKSR